MRVEKPPTLGELLERLSEEEPKLLMAALTHPEATQVAPSGKYRHWDTLRHLTPPEGLSHEQWWVAIKMTRHGLAKSLPLTDPEGLPFSYLVPDPAQAHLHYIDQHASGEIAVSEVVTDDESARRQFLVNSLIEESIRSSQLEGATTTRRVAKDMIRSGRPPADRSERMILNNFRAMEYIRDDLGDELTPQSVLELQRILTEETLDNADAAGRVQRPDEQRISVWYGEVQVHEPPPAEQLAARLEALCDFANTETDQSGFLHPVIRSILIHFWLGYDHPFEDGNGRTARALFYWSMRKHGYWLTEYLSISRIFRKAPAKYGRAFLFTETDERDATYFILFHLDVIRRAIDELQVYLRRKMTEIRRFERKLREADHFNHRQLALLQDAVRNPDQRYSFESHRRSHKVSFATSRNDLLDLWEKKLLDRRRIGRQYAFFPVEDIEEKLSS